MMSAFSGRTRETRTSAASEQLTREATGLAARNQCLRQEQLALRLMNEKLESERKAIEATLAQLRAQPNDTAELRALRDYKQQADAIQKNNEQLTTANVELVSNMEKLVGLCQDFVEEMGLDVSTTTVVAESLVELTSRLCEGTLTQDVLNRVIPTLYNQVAQHHHNDQSLADFSASLSPAPASVTPRAPGTAVSQSTGASFLLSPATPPAISVPQQDVVLVPKRVDFQDFENVVAGMQTLMSNLMREYFVLFAPLETNDDSHPGLLHQVLSMAMSTQQNLDIQNLEDIGRSVKTFIDHALAEQSRFIAFHSKSVKDQRRQMLRVLLNIHLPELKKGILGLDKLTNQISKMARVTDSSDAEAMLQAKVQILDWAKPRLLDLFKTLHKLSAVLQMQQSECGSESVDNGVAKRDVKQFIVKLLALAGHVAGLSDYFGFDNLVAQAKEILLAESEVTDRSQFESSPLVLRSSSSGQLNRSGQIEPLSSAAVVAGTPPRRSSLVNADTVDFVISTPPAIPSPFKPKTPVPPLRLEALRSTNEGFQEVIDRHQELEQIRDERRQESQSQRDDKVTARRKEVAQRRVDLNSARARSEARAQAALLAHAQRLAKAKEGPVQASTARSWQ
ncbi:MAG: hypothetical protein AB7F28_06450 [Candidatus Margulisiibacteriota bacterium]